MGEQLSVTNPSGRLLKRMATRLGTSVGYLLGEAEDSDPIWLESNAAWRQWVDSTPEVNASVALAVRDEWRHEFHLNRSELSTVSFRKSNKALSKVDWDARYQNRPEIQTQTAKSGAGECMIMSFIVQGFAWGKPHGWDSQLPPTVSME
jgi:hypothetical protein